MAGCFLALCGGLPQLKMQRGEERRHGRAPAADLSCPHCWRQSRLSRRLRFRHTPRPNWTGRFSSNWFLIWQLGRRFSQADDDANINTVTPNATVVSDPGAVARNLTIGANGTGMLTIQNGGTLADQFGTIGNLPGGVGTVTVTGAGSSWTNVNDVVVGGLGTGTAYNSRRRLGSGRHDGEQYRRLDRIVCRLDGHGDSDRPGLQLDQRATTAGSISAVLAPAPSRSRTAGGSSISLPSSPTSATVQARTVP